MVILLVEQVVLTSHLICIMLYIVYDFFILVHRCCNLYYRHAAVYISLSEHEGFCVPLVESMAADVPVLAYAAAAVPDTLGGAGVQFAPKDLEHAAELLGELAFDDELRAAVIAGQRRRL